jgi:hypothetical protein
MYAILPYYHIHQDMDVLENIARDDTRIHICMVLVRRGFSMVPG